MNKIREKGCDGVALLRFLDKEFVKGSVESIQASWTCWSEENDHCDSIKQKLIGCLLHNLELEVSLLEGLEGAQ